MKRTCFIATIGLLLFGQYAVGQQMKINQSQQIKDLMEVKKEFGQQEKTYQIQIYNGTITEANEEIKRASGKYSYPCFLAFETPNYKVRMGQFLPVWKRKKPLLRSKICIQQHL